jgi:subtilisin
MKFRIITALLLTSVLSASAAVSTNSAAVPPVKKRYIVTMKPEASPDAFVAQRNLKPRQMLPKARSGFAANLAGDEALILPGLKMVICDLDSDEAQTALKDSDVLFVEADGPVSLCMQTNATGIERIGIPQFPLARINGTNEPIDVTVAVLDSGIDPHPDLNIAHFWSPFTSDPSDELQHGTGVAGVIGALDNDFGVVGVAPGVRLWNIKVFNPAGADWADILEGMNYCYENSDQISVVNMSFGNEGTTAPFNSMRGVVRLMVNAGIVVVAAAGNNNRDIAGPNGTFGNGDDSIPAALPDVMAVSGMNPTNDTIWIDTPGVLGSNFSQIERTNTSVSYPVANYVTSPGRAIDVAAPAFGILTTYTNDSYARFKGTSMAAPHVAGLVALYIAANGRATNAAGVYAIRQAIVNASLPQSQWNTNNTQDPDTNPEPLAIASEAWIPKPVLTNSGAPGNFQLGFSTIPGYDYAVQVHPRTSRRPPLSGPIVATVTTGSLSNARDPRASPTPICASQSFYRLARQSLLPRLLLITQPQSRTNIVGSIASLSVFVSGEAPVHRWHKDGVPLTDGGKISGATTSELTLTGVQSTDAGNYSVIATNAYGSVTSAVATLTIQSTLLVTGVVATATSEITSLGRYASNAVNGVQFDSSFWESVGVGQGFGNDPSPAITFDLGAVRFAENARIWNGHEAGPSIERMLVASSTDGVNFSPVGEFTLTTISPASETIALGQVSCRYVRFTILENGDGQIFPVIGPPTAGTFVALDEVEFREYLPD